MKNKRRQPDIDRNHIVSSPPMKKAMDKLHAMYKQGWRPTHIDRERAEDKINVGDEDSGIHTEEQSKVKEESEPMEEDERTGTHREENTSGRVKIGIGGKVIEKPSDYGPKIEVRNVIQ